MAVKCLVDEKATDELYLYLVGMLDIGTYLLKRPEGQDHFPLHCICKPVISYGRLLDSRLSICDTGLSLALKFHVLAQSISDDVRTSDRRLTALADWEGGLLAEPPWTALVEAFIVEIHSLRAIFEFHLQSRDEVPQNSHANWIRHLLNSVELRYLVLSKSIHATLFGPQSVNPL
jgi:hypothetical protein